MVQIFTGDGQPWDDHGDIPNHRNKARTVDQPIAALLKDLKRRGLLEDTLVLWGGEFGRTPTSEGAKGRDHNNHGFTVWLAGGGVKGGMVYGATDEFGFAAAERTMHVHDLHATILHLMGIDHETADLSLLGPRFPLDRRLGDGEPQHHRVRHSNGGHKYTSLTRKRRITQNPSLARQACIILRRSKYNHTTGVRGLAHGPAEADSERR